MRTPDHHPTRREAEQLLDDPAGHGSALGTLLSAAAAPALPGELRREDAEVAAFHRARLTPATGHAAGFVSPRRLAGRAAARAVIATGAVVALTTGGFALANSAHLPGLPGQASDQATESVAKSPQSSTSSTTAVAPSETPGSKTSGTTPGVESPEATDTGSSSPTPNYEGLCRAFQATDHSAHGSSLSSAAFAALSAAAGGDTHVATWCVALIGEPKETGKPSELPTPTSKPTSKPSGKPSALPTSTAKPTQAATAKPTQQPTGKPSTAPGAPTDKPTPTDKGGGRKP